MLYIGYTFYLPTVCKLLGITCQDMADLKAEWKYTALIEEKLKGSGLFLESLDKGVYVLGIGLKDFDYFSGGLTATKGAALLENFNLQVCYGIKEAGIDLSKPVEIAHMEAESTWETNPEPRVFVWQG